MYSTTGSLLRLFGVDSATFRLVAGKSVLNLAGALAVALGLGALFIKAVFLVLNPLLPYQVVGRGL